MHLAAESHVDRSIEDSRAFVLSNVLGTQIVLEACRELGRPLVFVSRSFSTVRFGPRMPMCSQADAEPGPPL